MCPDAQGEAVIFAMGLPTGRASANLERAAEKGTDWT
jgi:hypothetical protein